jgi:hypothetical protein
MYDPETAIWRTLQSMNSRRHGCAAAVISFWKKRFEFSLRYHGRWCD